MRSNLRRPDRLELHTFTACAFMFAGVVVYGLVALPSKLEPHGISVPFDPELWNRDPSCESGTPERHFQSLRMVQVEDLLAHRLRTGMTKEELRELLGRPESTNEREGGQAHEWVYLVGSDVVCNPLVTLRINLDANDRITSSRVVDDTFQYK